jgi:hypothetical protein
MKILFCVQAVTQLSFVVSLRNAGHDVDLILPVIPRESFVAAGFKTYFADNVKIYKQTISDVLATGEYDWMFPSWMDIDDIPEFISNINKQYNFGGLQPETIPFLKTKMHYYRVFDELGIPYPKVYATVEPYEDIRQLPDGMQFPVVAKPSFLRSKPGMEVFTDPSKLLEFVSGRTSKFNAQYNPCGQPYMLQQYIQGNSCAVSGVVKNGKVFVEFAYDIEDAYPFCPEAGMLYPSKYEHMLLTATVEPLEKFFKHIKFDNSIFNMDIVIDKDNNFYFLDFGGRVGTHPVMLMYHAGEHEIAKKITDKILHDVDYAPDLKQAVIFRSLKLDPGVIVSISCSRPELAQELTLPNNVIWSLANDTMVYENGYAVVVAPTREEAEQKYQELKDSIQVEYKLKFRDRFHERYYKSKL